MIEENKYDNIIVEKKWEVPYRISVGDTYGRFFTELRDNAKLLGTRCDEHNKVYFPLRTMCEKNLNSIKDNWVEIEPEGTLEAFTIVTENYVFQNMPKPPFVICLVRLGKADTSVPLILKGIDLSDPREAAKRLKVGDRVKVVFKEKRTGCIEDIHVELKAES